MKNKKETAYDLVIPGAIRNDSRLSRSEWIFYAEIRGLCRRTGSCYASNAYLGEIMDVDNRTIQRWIIHLEKCGHITVEHGSDENKNRRNIYLTDAKKRNSKGMTEMSYPATGMSHPATPVSGGMTNVSPKGMTSVSQVSGGIRKNINITSSSRRDDDVDLTKIPQKIRGRFDTVTTLRRFAKSCSGDFGVMQRYLDHADASKAKNPLGLAVSLAQEHGAKGPPGTRDAQGCGFCDQAAVKYVMRQGRSIGMCAVHRAKYIEAREKKEHLAMLAKAK